MPEKPVDFSSLRKEAQSSEPPAPGSYTVQCMDADLATTSTGKDMIKCRYRVIGGPEDGKGIWDNFVLSTGNPTALDIFFRHIEAHGVNLDNYSTSQDDLIAIANRMVGAKVNVRIDHREFEGRVLPDIKSLTAVADARKRPGGGRGGAKPRPPKKPSALK